MKSITLNIPDLSDAAEEALNRLRVNIKFSGANVRKILITSSVPNEGKTHISVYLWKMLAEAGFKTVFVDLDLRKSVLKKELDFSPVDDEKGLSDYLAGFAEYDEVIYHTNVPDADMVPCFSVLQNPSPLLQDPKLEEFFKKLEENYDYIIVDSPPLISVSDGVLIAAVCDGTILVVRSGETPKRLVRQSLNFLERTGCRFLGTVLNGVETAHHGYGSYYGGYYSRYGKYYGDYYYGADGEKKKRKKHGSK